MAQATRFITQQQVDRAKMREMMLKKVPAEYHDAMGLKLGAGADHPRAWVGPPFLYDLIGANQFQLLIDLGMREYHRFLDVGCGSLRLGRLAMTYLMPERYFGVEPGIDILNRGCEMHFGAPLETSQVIAAKKPKFVHNTEFDFSFTEGPVDFVFAQSIASHTGPQMTKDLLNAIAGVSHDDTVSMVTFIRTKRDDKVNTVEGWFYPECVEYTDEVFGQFATEAGLHAYRATWPSSNVRHDGLISGQMPTILTKKPWEPGLAMRMNAALFEGIIKIN